MEEPINQAARKHEEQVENWDYGEASRRLYLFFDLLNERFFGASIPTPILSFKRKRGNGHYVIGRNEIGVRENINISEEHLSDPLAEVLATLTHEMVHAWQHNYGTPGKRNYHNKACQRKMAEIGIPCNRWGRQLGMTDPFVSFLREHGVSAEMRLVQREAKQQTAARSRLIRWQCGCMSIWATRDVRAKCLGCGKDFVCA